MKNLTMVLLTLTGLVGITACSDNSNENENNQEESNSRHVNVDELSAGAYVASIGNEDQPTVGKYYSGTEGDRLFILNNDNDQAETIYRQSADGVWQVVPESSESVDITLLRSDAISVIETSIADLAGNYVTFVGDEVVVRFSLDASGALRTITRDCQISGQVGDRVLPNTYTLSLDTTGCGELDAQSQGELVLDTDYSPASFRLVAANGQQIIDLWAYSE